MCCNEVYDAVPVSDAHGWSRRTQKYIMLGLVSFGFLATAAITGVALIPRGSQSEGSSGINTPRPSPSLSPTLLATEMLGTGTFPNSTTRPESGINTSLPSPSLFPTLFITENNVNEKLTACSLAFADKVRRLKLVIFDTHLLL